MMADTFTERKITPWERVCNARDRERPRNPALINAVFREFTELHGDRSGGDDKAVTGGVAFLDDIPVTVIAHRKGNSTTENIEYNFGMPGPSGYRKAHRLMEQAEKFGRPVITFIDTPGAYPGPESEENGISVAIAENLALLSRLKTPVIAIVTGEGGSGGALALGVGDRLWMLENAVYSVLSPEGFATILWKDSTRTKEACEVMKMTADDLKNLGIADEVIAEPDEGLANALDTFARELRRKLLSEIKMLQKIPTGELVAARYEKLRHFEGAFAP